MHTSPGSGETPARRKAKLIVGGSLIGLVAIVATLVMAGVTRASGGTAPNGPGSSSFWTPSNNSVIGTAANTTSDVWFTGYNGIIGEIFYPTDDTANTTDLQFLVGDSGHTWDDLEKSATTSTPTLYNNHALAWNVTNTATSGKYKFVKTFYTDPSRNSRDPAGDVHGAHRHAVELPLYTLYNPIMQNAGNNNSSSTQTYNSTTMLVTTDSSGNYASALARRLPMSSGMTSSGFVGQNDGWTDLKGSVELRQRHLSGLTR